MNGWGIYLIFIVSWIIYMTYDITKSYKDSMKAIDELAYKIKNDLGFYGIKKEKITMNNWTNDEKINKMIAEITRLRVKLLVSEMRIFDGYCPRGVTSNYDEICSFDDCNDCKRAWIQEQLKETEKEVLEEYGIKYKEDDNNA